MGFPRVVGKNHSVEDVVQIIVSTGHARSARTFACRVRTLANILATEPKRSQECERGTQMCVRYGVFMTFGGQQAHGNSLTVVAR